MMPTVGPHGAGGLKARESPGPEIFFLTPESFEYSKTTGLITAVARYPPGSITYSPALIFGDVISSLFVGSSRIALGST